MTPFEVYEVYLSIKMHFTEPTYDYFKYSGKVKSNINSFNKRQDRYFFEKLSRKKLNQEILDYFVSNFIEVSDPAKMWVGEMKTNGDTNYIKWKGRIQSLSYVFEQDLKTLTSSNHLYESLFPESKVHPKVIKSYLASKISPETLVILNDLTSFVNKLSESQDPVLSIVINKIKKYKPFVNYDKKLLIEKIRSVL